VQDAVITGHDHHEIGALLFLTDAGRALAPAALAEQVRAGLKALRAEGGGSSQTPACVLALPDAPNAAVGEITDKGYVNQRLVLARRMADVQTLQSTPTPAHVIRL
jgi:feruloyl-CoA synthase